MKLENAVAIGTDMTKPANEKPACALILKHLLNIRLMHLCECWFTLMPELGDRSLYASSLMGWSNSTFVADAVFVCVCEREK